MQKNSIFKRKYIFLIISQNIIWLIGEKNANEIYNVTKDRYTNISISLIKIYEILEKTIYVIAHYIKDQYAIENISEQGKNEFFAIDESNFVNTC